MKATNYARASYQEVYDVMTKEGKVSLFGFHTPTGLAPYEMLSGFFRQFRKYKYSGMSVTLVPAAQLPADPLQISYAAGTEGYIDPRDLQNPILFHGAHGYNLGQALNVIYSGTFTADGSAVQLQEIDHEKYIGSRVERDEDGNIDSIVPNGANFEQWYYAAMLDPSFRKFNVMNNIKLPFMSPRVHNLAVDKPLQPAMNGYEVIQPSANDTSDFEDFNVNLPSFGNVAGGTEPQFFEGVSRGYNYMTNRLMKLGWLDTFTFDRSEIIGTNTTKLTPVPVISPLPRLMMGVLVMPPSYRVQLCFRMIVTHYFEFARFNTAITEPNYVSTDPSSLGQYTENYNDWLPASITDATSLMLSDTVDSIDGEVKQVVSGVY